MLDFGQHNSTGEQWRSYTLNPDMLKLARESRGLTQKELSQKIGIRQGTYSKIEGGTLSFTDEVADRVSTELEYPKSFFERHSKLYPLSVTYYRRNLTLPKKTLLQVEARLDVVCMSIAKLTDSVDCPPTNLPVWDVEKYGSPEKAAISLREMWRVPKGPLRKLIELIEDNGILVVGFDFGADGIDGFAIRGAHNDPIIFFNSNLPGDRRRLTIAHELAHLMLHIGLKCAEHRDIEKEAFGFASEFLVPASEFAKSFVRLDLPTLAGMKQYWSVSMQSLIVKAQNHSLITANQSRYLWQLMAKNDYLKREPVAIDVPIEEPSLLREIIEVYQSELEYSIDEIAQSVSLTTKEFLQTFFTKKRSLFKIVRSTDADRKQPSHSTEKSTGGSMKRVT